MDQIERSTLLVLECLSVAASPFFARQERFSDSLADILEQTFDENASQTDPGSSQEATKALAKVVSLHISGATSVQEGSS